jgi:hypothetical protein
MRTKLIAGSVATLAVAAGSMSALAGSAEAFDRGECDRAFGAANVVDHDLMQKDTGDAGKADFGDHAHLFGAPQGTAVVCWSDDGAVLLRGRVFNDPSGGGYAGVAAARLTYDADQGPDIVRTVSAPAPVVSGGMWQNPVSALVNHGFRRTGASFHSVTIQLLRNGQAVGQPIIKSRG